MQICYDKNENTDTISNWKRDKKIFLFREGGESMETARKKKKPIQRRQRGVEKEETP